MTVEDHRKKGDGFFKKGQFQDAIQSYEEALKADPHLFDVWMRMGESYGHVGNFQEALSCFKKALEIKPTSSDAWYNQGQVYSMLADPIEALYRYRKAVEFTPEHSLAWYDMGVTYERLYQYHNAIGAYQEVLSLDPDDELALYGIGGVYEKLKQYQDALYYYTRICSLYGLHLEFQLEFDNEFWIFFIGRVLGGIGFGCGYYYLRSAIVQNKPIIDKQLWIPIVLHGLWNFLIYFFDALTTAVFIIFILSMIKWLYKRKHSKLPSPYL